MQQRALEMLAAVGLDHRSNHRPSELSGGEHQRVAIARALVNTTHAWCWLMSQPVTWMCSHNADSIIELLDELNVRQGTAFLVVTHDLQLAKRMSRQLEMHDGRLTHELTLMGAQ